jgi:hypothetical protein
MEIRQDPSAAQLRNGWKDPVCVDFRIAIIM